MPAAIVRSIKSMVTTEAPRSHPLLRAARWLTTPLLPDDFLGLVNPLWSAGELRGRIEQVRPEPAGAVTVVIRPGAGWQAHRPGQYVPLGVDVDGVRHWRTYSLTSVPGDGRISITVGPVDGGVVSGYLARRAAPGAVVRLGTPEGEFVLPDPVPRRLLFVTAGTGLTPVMGMLRSHNLGSHHPCRDVRSDAVLVHSARNPGDVLFGDELRALAATNPGLRLVERHTAIAGRLTPAEVQRLCPDWADRQVYACGPAGLLDDLTEHWRAAGHGDALHVERFHPPPLLTSHAGGANGYRVRGAIRFTKSGRETTADGHTTLLAAGERAGALLPSGCRMGICHTCIGPLRSGAVRDLRTGEVRDTPGEMVQTCVSAAACDVEIEL